MNALALSAAPITPAATAPQQAYDAKLMRLNRASVKKHFDAYEDVDWDAPENAIDPCDPRFELGTTDPLGDSAWYQALPQRTRARLGLHLATRQVQVGIHFEGILSQGLLAFAATLRSGSPELRYALHETIEEGQHSLMFQELVARTGLQVEGITGVRRRMANRVPTLGRTNPELFFIHVLAGEAPIDAIQRRELRKGDALHPLFRRVMRIHVIEEARHMCFAEEFLRRTVPELPFHRRAYLAIAAPITLATTLQQMVHIPYQLADQYEMPIGVREAFRDSAELQRRGAESLAPVAKLCRELGLLNSRTEWLWHSMGLLPRKSSTRLLSE